MHCGDIKDGLAVNASDAVDNPGRQSSLLLLNHRQPTTEIGRKSEIVYDRDNTLSIPLCILCGSDICPKPNRRQSRKRATATPDHPCKASIMRHSNSPLYDPLKQMPRQSSFSFLQTSIPNLTPLMNLTPVNSTGAGRALVTGLREVAWDL